MTEDAELQARIAAINEQINQHKQQLQQEQHQHPPKYQHQFHPRGRWAPYSHARGGGFQRPHKNRTLLLGGNQSSPPSRPTAHLSPSPRPPAYANPSAPAEPYVFAQGPGRKQLMNKDTFEREQKQLLEQKQDARMAKRQKIDRKERLTLEHHLNASPASNNRVLVVDGVRFQLRDDGNKLIRIHEADSSTKETPKKVQIAGVDFYRTKSGNLVRANAMRTLLRPANRSKTQCENFTKHGTQKPAQTNRQAEDQASCMRRLPLSTTDTHIGICAFGPNCKFAHDPDKVAVCKTFLHTGSCAAGDSCDLSHVTSYHRVPACTHFLRGNCTKDACPYPHIHVSSSAPVCRPFALLGYCSAGEECTKRHVFECPDYSNTGVCANRENGKCSLPHPDYASTLRKAANRQAKNGSEDESDVSSDEERQGDDTGFDDIDSDEAEDVIMGGDSNDHAVSQQQDYIAFS